MQSKLIILVLFIGLSYVVRGNDISSEIAKNGNYKSLCKTLDLDCVRSYLTKNGKCAATCNNEGASVYVEEQVAYIPSIGLVVVCNRDNVTYSGYKVIAFYKDRNTNKVVLVIKFKGITIETPYAEFYFSQVAEPAVFVTDYVKVTYSAILTAIFPAGDNIRLKDVIVTSQQINENPTFDIGKNVTNSPYKVVQDAYAAFAADLFGSTKQLFLTKQYYFLHNFLSTHVADCGYRYNGHIINY